MNELKEVRRVLLVEDDTDQIFLLSTLLESANYVVDSTDNTKTGIALYEKNRYFCAVVDIMMPDGGAKAFLAATQRTAPVIVMTAAQESLTHESEFPEAFKVCSKRCIQEDFLDILERTSKACSGS